MNEDIPRKTLLQRLRNLERIPVVMMSPASTSFSAVETSRVNKSSAIFFLFLGIESSHVLILNGVKRPGFELFGQSSHRLLAGYNFPASPAFRSGKTLRTAARSCLAEGSLPFIAGGSLDWSS